MYQSPRALRMVSSILKYTWVLNVYVSPVDEGKQGIVDAGV